MKRSRPRYRGVFKVDLREPMTSPRNRKRTRKALGMKPLRNRRAVRRALQMRQRTAELGERRVLECRFESAVARARMAAEGDTLIHGETESLWDAVDAASKLLHLKGR